MKGISVRQLKAARALLDWSQDDLARFSGVSKPTIARLETDEDELGGNGETRVKLVAAVRAAGVDFMSGDHGGVKIAEPTVFALKSLALYVDRHAELAVRQGARSPTIAERKATTEAIRRVCDRIAALGDASRTKEVAYGEFEALLERLHKLAAYPTNEQVSAVAKALTSR